ncbi:MAG: DUF5050 domain-containing protein [Ruminococcus flavefaciens]|nr:DUF5050 domain-containing protein [Ruminococcus flavefaciens]
MKKFILILCMIALVGCGKKVPQSDMEFSETISRAVPEITIEPTTVSDFNAVTDIEPEKPDENYYLNSSKALFSADKGRYYYVYKDGRDSAYYVLGYEDSEKKYSFLENADDFTAYLYKDGTFYGSYRSDKLCSFKDGKYKSLKYEDRNISDFYFTEQYIYFLCKGDTETEILRMRYDGTDAESIAVINLMISKYAVHDGKIFYEADYLKYGVYDTETAENTSLSDGGAGIFCGDYMYYISSEHHLFRMNTSDYSCEKICENVRRIAVYEDYIIYQPYSSNVDCDGQLYRLGKGENKKIFDAGDFFENGYYYDISVQAEKEKIFIEVSSGPYFRYIAEMDIDGNITDTIYAHTSA